MYYRKVIILRYSLPRWPEYVARVNARRRFAWVVSFPMIVP